MITQEQAIEKANNYTDEAIVKAIYAAQYAKQTQRTTQLIMEQGAKAVDSLNALAENYLPETAAQTVSGVLSFVREAGAYVLPKVEKGAQTTVEASQEVVKRGLQAQSLIENNLGDRPAL
jgi:hypothetical protein